MLIEAVEAVFKSSFGFSYDDQTFSCKRREKERSTRNGEQTALILQWIDFSFRQITISRKECNWKNFSVIEKRMKTYSC